MVNLHKSQKMDINTQEEIEIILDSIKKDELDTNQIKELSLKNKNHELVRFFEIITFYDTFSIRETLLMGNFDILNQDDLEEFHFDIKCYSLYEGLDYYNKNNEGFENYCYYSARENKNLLDAEEFSCYQSEVDDYAKEEQNLYLYQGYYNNDTEGDDEGDE